MLHVDKNFSFILFGASGHLAKIKIFPALYLLALKKRLPEKYSIIGFARTDMTDTAFRTQFESAVRADMGGEVNESVLQELLSHVTYHTGDYTKVEDFKSLAKKLTAQEKSWKDPVRVTYLSIPPSVFAPVLRNLCEGGIHDHKHKGRDFRCIVEKPVGHDSASFQQVRAALYSCFQREEVYLLDHYVGKEAIRNIFYLRFANPVIERLLKNTIVKHVQIAALEHAGIEGRAGYFDQVGTLRDMFQSHLLEMTALLTMRLLEDDASMKASRLDALRKLYLPPASDLSEIVMQGQYQKGTIGKESVKGYLEEADIQKGSKTPTYAAMKIMSRSSRWAGVPIYLRSGKRLKKKETRISIEFHDSTALGKDISRNRLDIIAQGEAGMKLFLQTKIGGSEPAFRPLIMEDPLVCMGDCFVEHSLLLLEAINGNQTWFLDPEEVQTCWNLIDPLQNYLSKDATPLHLYKAGTIGPEKAQEFIRRDGHEWFE
jgi:glucose-6-phosphate 1-dehydrogenase